ncbi:hypothetical protein GCM10022223_61930 [Kineosporia mesophila]|uniref:Uncharacterized protein n=1 Tax=Kineosporia mesophila TaxID=566012 RepID=A0ABP7ALR2_9ACTN|nr:hypothetical protein [Kineosporia mesophila]MCD5353996.1 hypothetical protein [Kineosporia mesophila]
MPAGIAERPELVRRLRISRAAALWTALAGVVLVALLWPEMRSPVQGFAKVYGLFIVGFLIAVTRTMRWTTAARMYALALLWSLVAVVALLVLFPDGPAPSTIGLAEESLKLAPVAALAFVVPRRARQFSVTDWLLLGFTAGLAFQAVREMAHEVSGSDSPGTQFVSTAIITATVGLAIVVWRRAAVSSGAGAVVLRGFALAAPVLVGWLAVSGRTVDDPSGATASVPLPLRWGRQVVEALPLHERVPSVALLAAVLVLALLVDARHLLAVDARRGDLTILPVPWLAVWWTHAWSSRLVIEGPPDPVGEDTAEDDADPRRSGAQDNAAERDDAKAHSGGRRASRAASRKGGAARSSGGEVLGASGRAVAEAWRTLVVATCALVAYASRDRVVILAAHAGATGESRLTRLVRGRAAAEMVRHARREAFTTQAGPGGSRAVPGWRVSAAAVLMILLAGAWLAGGWPSGPVGEGPPNPGVWWSGLTVWRQLMVVGGLIALAGLSAGSLGQAFGVSGAAPYLASHGRGAATFVRDPRSAVRAYLSRVTPGALLTDGAELTLTFVPVNFGGAVQNRAVRLTAEDYLHAFDLGGVSDFLAKAEDFSELAARAVPEHGYHDVIIQGMSTGLGFSHRALARLILNDANYGGGPVRLVSGAVGGVGAATAQNLADKLGVEVLAPSGTVFAFRSGRLVVGPSPLATSGRWIPFRPGASR